MVSLSHTYQNQSIVPSQVIVAELDTATEVLYRLACKPGCIAIGRRSADVEELPKSGVDLVDISSASCISNFDQNKRPKTYIPGIRGYQQSLLEAEYCLGTEALGLIQVCQFAPSFRVSGYRVKELD